MATQPQTLCWECKKATGKCSWSKNFTPVEGWKAEKTDRKYVGKRNRERWVSSYLVISCPEFERG